MLFKEKKNQTIHCDVKSCKHHKDCKCELDEIKVGSSCDDNNAKYKDETICSNFKKDK